jgi:hypothetical protein
VQLDERVAKLPLTAHELAPILLERRSTRAGSTQLLSPGDESSDPLPYTEVLWKRAAHGKGRSYPRDRRRRTLRSEARAL